MKFLVENTALFASHGQKCCWSRLAPLQAQNLQEELRKVKAATAELEVVSWMFPPPLYPVITKCGWTILYEWW